MNQSNECLVPKDIEGVVMELFINNNYGKCLLSRQTIERRIGPRNETERKRLTRKLNSMVRKGILIKVDALDRGVWYVFAAIAHKFPHAIEMARKAESLGDVGVVLITPETPGMPLLFLRQSDPEERKRPGRPAH